MKKAVYTVGLGNGYALKEPVIISDGWDHICFTDRTDLHSDVWSIRRVESFDDINRRSRAIKILNEEYLSGYDMSVYLDSKFVVKTDLTAFCRVHPEDIVVMKHNRRNCLFQEAQFLLNSNIVSIKEKSIIRNQVKKYSESGMIRGFGLWAPGIMIRRHWVKSVSKMMYDWYEEIINYSYRDIISFPYVLRMNPDVKLGEMDFSETYNLFMGQ